MSKHEEKIVVGSVEWCAFPGLGIPALKARVDSGAKTSSIHAFNIQPFSRHGKPWISFEVHPLQKNRRTVVRCEAPIVDRRAVKSSSGSSEKRYVIRTPLVLDGKEWLIEVTLANRDSMGFRMLLGREAMSGRLLVDPADAYCLGDKSKQQIHEYYGDIESATYGLKIGLLASNPELYSNQRLMEAGDERGHEMVFLNIKHCYMKLDATAPEVHYRGGSVLNDLDAVITRIKPDMNYYGCALARHFESMGVYTSNNAMSIAQSLDKLFALQLLLQNGVEIPTTGCANSPMDTGDLIEMVAGAPLNVKLLEGTPHRGVVMAETRKAAESVINAFKSLNANLLVQEYVKEAEGKEIRCLVIDGKVVAAIQRESASGEFRSDYQKEAAAIVAKISVDEKKLAIKAAKILGLKVAAVDFIRSSKGPLLLDVSSSPGLEGIETVTGKDIAGAMITSIEKKLNWKRELAANMREDC